MPKNIANMDNATINTELKIELLSVIKSVPKETATNLINEIFNSDKNGYAGFA